MNNSYYSSLFDLTGKTAIVTGGTGILGKCFCSGLAEFGANIVIIDLNEALAQSDAIELVNNYNIEAIGIGCDISSPDEVKKAIQRIIKKFNHIHILHNNAQGVTAAVPFEKCTLEQWRLTSAVNEEGYFLMAQAVGEYMISQNIAGSIIQTSSIYGVMAPDHRVYEGSSMGSRAVYSFTKAGIVGLTKYLATYWAKYGIRVNTITPGGVENGQDNGFNLKYSSRIPLGRMAKREEMVSALLYLASNASSYVTGQNIIIDGGLNAW